jgi:hypothetical protein
MNADLLFTHLFSLLTDGIPVLYSYIILPMWTMLVLLFGVLLLFFPKDSFAETLLTPLQRKCELEALNVATRLADHFNKYDEDTEWDVRLHSDYLVEHLGFAGWIQSGLWKNTELTAEHQNTKQLHQVGSI